ncbi:MAG: hypothetical protein FWE03_04965 [Firmicutes bacterium]|nr:hypothetical protein [Bacillota bacterium]
METLTIIGFVVSLLGLAIGIASFFVTIATLNRVTNGAKSLAFKNRDDNKYKKLFNKELNKTNKITAIGKRSEDISYQTPAFWKSFFGDRNGKLRIMYPNPKWSISCK